MEALDKIMEALFIPYRERVPDVEKIVQAMVEQAVIGQESDIENDHVAFRTLGVPHLGIASFEKDFLHYGYTKKEAYHFAKKSWMPFGIPLQIRVFLACLSANCGWGI